MTNKEAIFYLKQVREDYEGKEFVEGKEALEIAIKALEERPQGEWKFIQGATTQGSLKCPFCDYRDYHKTNSNFCPNCGAKMKGKNSSGEAYD